MTFLLIVGGICLVLGVVFGLFDRYPDQPDDRFIQAKHVRLLDDQKSEVRR